MNDLVSRKYLLECIEEGWVMFDTERDKNLYIHLVRDIAPSKEGKWIADNPKDGGFWVCSNCGFPSEAFAADMLYKFCPNCGADMREDKL